MQVPVLYSIWIEMVMEVVMKNHILQRYLFCRRICIRKSGDCDDSNPLNSHFDLDEDGYSSCSGDGDDDFWTSVLSVELIQDSIDQNCDGVDFGQERSIHVGSYHTCGIDEMV